MHGALFVTDLDGTLLRGGETREGDIRALAGLRAMGASTVLATGRSGFSFGRCPAAGRLPVDFLVLSSGACIVDHPGGELLLGVSMTGEEAAPAVEELLRLELDFALHEAVPLNHRFLHSLRSGANPDMERRIALYAGHCRPFEHGVLPDRCTQLVAIVPRDPEGTVFRNVLEALGDRFSVVRTTSPLDGESLWIEIFPAGVCKSQGARWLADRLGASPSRTCAVGNDWNDLDLLDWAALSFVMEGAPEGLAAGRRKVASVAEAAALWTEALGSGAVV